MKNDHLFYLEIKHKRNHLKLPVFSYDTFEKLALRLVEITETPTFKHIKMA
jgi:hypothetical protein